MAKSTKIVFKSYFAEAKQHIRDTAIEHLKNQIYSIKCPKCDAEIQVPVGNSECPKCKYRIPFDIDVAFQSKG